MKKNNKIQLTVTSEEQEIIKQEDLNTTKLFWLCG
jgi:hypothetical protein